MADRDRLIELIDGFVFGTQIIVNSIEWDSNKVKELADCLIANGVILPPCKVGDMVFTIYHDSLSVYKVTELIINDFLWAKLYNPDYSREYKSKLVCLDFSFNEFVFLTREEAEKALERSNLKWKTKK